MQAHRNRADNSMTTRADGGIALYDTGNVEGTGWIYNLNTNRIMRRNKLEILSTPKIVIDHMDNFCNEERRRRGTEPIFDVGTNRRAVDDDDYDYHHWRAAQEVADHYFTPAQSQGVDNDPVADLHYEERVQELEHPDQQLYDLNLGGQVFQRDDDDVTVSDIADDGEGDDQIFRDIAADTFSDHDDDEIVDEHTEIGNDYQIFEHIREHEYIYDKPEADVTDEIGPD